MPPKKRLQGRTSDSECEQISENSHYIGSYTLNQVLQTLLRYFGSKCLLDLRSVSRTWNDEVCRILGSGKRSNFNILLTNTRLSTWSQIFNMTTNPNLFSNCKLLKLLPMKNSTALFINYGSIITRFTIELTELPKPAEFSTLCKIVWNWCPNLKFLKLLALNLRSRSGLYLNRKYPKTWLEIEELELGSDFPALFPSFSIALIKHSPKLRALRFPLLSPRPPDGTTNFFKTLEILPEITKKLDEFMWSNASEYEKVVVLPSVVQMQFGIITKMGMDLSPPKPSFNPDVTDITSTLDKVKDTLTDLRIWSHSRPNYDGVIYPIILTSPLHFPHLKRFAIHANGPNGFDLCGFIANMPRLKALELRGDYYAIHRTTNLDWFFPLDLEEDAKCRPHLSLRKLVSLYPVRSVSELQGVVTTFPNLEWVELFIQTPDEPRKPPVGLTEVFQVLTGLRKLANFVVWTRKDSFPEKEWMQALSRLKSFSCLNTLTIEMGLLDKNALMTISQCLQVQRFQPGQSGTIMLANSKFLM